MRVKTKTPDDQKKGVVYEVPCADCNKVYIGETGINLKMRLKECRYAVKRQDEKNGIAVHTQESGHSVNCEAARVRMNEEHITRRKVLESILILESSNTNNLDAGLSLNSIWRPLLKVHHAHSNEDVPSNDLSLYHPLSLSLPITRLNFPIFIIVVSTYPYITPLRNMPPI